MARLYCRMLVLLAVIVFSWPMLSHASIPFMRRGSFVVHRKIHKHANVNATLKFSSMSNRYSHDVSDSSSSSDSEQTIRLQKVSLSKVAHTEINNYVRNKLSHSSDSAQASAESDEQVSLGMNGVPVLDQGGWGSCVTFAVTAGLDAYYGLHGADEISQLCDLALGLSLHTSGSEGGWDGANADDILGQITQYGFLTKSYEHSSGCGGLKHYPTYSSSHGSAMSARSFASASPDHRVTATLWHSLGVYAASDSAYKIRMRSPRRALDDVKAAIRRGHRVVIGLIIDPNVGDVGASGSYHGYDDMWMVSDLLGSSLEGDVDFAGHELLVTGFNDGCIDVSADDTKKSVCGYLTVRNSWGSYAGDGGDYYVSYDYFQILADEAYELG